MSAPPPSHDLDEVAPIPILPGPGEQLRAAREAAGMSVHEISTHMRLDRRVVLALEADDYEQLPAPTFVRGYLRGYARLLELPPEPVLQAFEQRDFAPPSLVADISVRSQMRSGDFPFRIVTYIVVAALILLVVLWWRSQDFAPVRFDKMPMGEPRVSESDSAVRVDDGAAPESLSPAVQPEATQPDVSEPELAEAEVADPEATTLLDAAPASEPDGVASSDAPTLIEAEPVAPADEEPSSTTEGEAGETAPRLSESEAAEVESESTEIGEDAAESVAAGDEPAAATLEEETTAAETAESPAFEEPAEEAAEVDAGEAPEDQSLLALETGDEGQPDTGATADRLGMSFTVECWLEVYDRADERLFYGLAQPGELLDLRGRGPIRLVLGNSEGVKVSYNGTPVDFSAFTARGVARFSVGGEPPTAFQTPAAPESAGDLESSGN